MNKSLIVTLVFSLLFIPLFSQVERGLKTITEESVRAQLEFLASDWTEGRATASKGEFLAGDYIKSIFQMSGLEGAGDYVSEKLSRAERWSGKKAKRFNSYFQSIPFHNYQKTEGNILKIRSIKNGVETSINFEDEIDVSIRPDGLNQSIESDVVFAGYGFVSKNEEYNDYEDIDVEGKIVLILGGYPGFKDTSSVAYKKYKPEGKWGWWRLKRTKSEEAVKRGAIAILKYDPASDINKSWMKNYPFRYNEDFYEADEKLKDFYDNNYFELVGDSFNSDLISVSISERTFNYLINEKFDVEKFNKKIKISLESDSKVIENKKVQIKTSVKGQLLKGRNVLAKIEGENPDEILVVGAHYDHVGKFGGFIWNGADDNASGTVGVMSIAKAIASIGIKPKRTIIFAAWTGEERGLYGSKYFVDNYKEKDKIKFNLNYDMIGRDDFDDSLGVKCGCTYTSTFPILKETVENINKKENFGLEINFKGSEKPSGGSDHSSFSGKGIPVQYFMAGWHKDYHKPSDHTNKINYKKLTKIIQLGYLNIWELANKEELFMK